MSTGRRPRIAILDYGMGNLRSVEKALERIGARPGASRATTTRSAPPTASMLPGVGAFPKAMRNLRELELDVLIGELPRGGVPTLGICLGMQLLFEASSENEGAWGLGLLQGRVERLPAPGLKVPHIGWNEVRWTRRSALTDEPARRVPVLLRALVRAGRDVSEDDVLGTSIYGEPFVVRRRARAALRRAVPPGEVERARPQAAARTSRRSARPSARLREAGARALSRHRRARRQGGAPRAGRLRAQARSTTPTRSTPPAGGSSRAPGGCTWSTSTGPARAGR